MKRYEIQERIRFSEVDASLHLTLSSLVNYFQDCSTFQSEAYGVGLARLAERNRAWFTRSWQIYINEYPKAGDEVRVFTQATGFDKMYGNRNFAMLDKEGRYLALADSWWFFFDTEKKRPVRVDEEEILAYGREERLPMPAGGHFHIELPEEMETHTPFSVLHTHLDSNKHVNNCQYIRMAEEYFPADFRPREMRAEYRQAAVLGDQITPRCGRSEDWLVAALCMPDQSPYAIVEVR